MKIGYMKVRSDENPDKADIKKHYAKAFEKFGVEKLVFDNAKREELPNLLEELKDGDELHLLAADHPTRDPDRLVEILGILRTKNVKLFFRGVGNPLVDRILSDTLQEGIEKLNETKALMAMLERKRAQQAPRDRGSNSPIAQKRLELGLTQQELGDLLGIPFRSIRNWEGNERQCQPYLERLILEKMGSIGQPDYKAVLSDLLDHIQNEAGSLKTDEAQTFAASIAKKIKEEANL